MKVELDHQQSLDAAHLAHTAGLVKQSNDLRRSVFYDSHIDKPNPKIVMHQ